MIRTLLRVVVSLFCGTVSALPSVAADAVDAWEKLPEAEIIGRRWDIPMGYDPVDRKILVLGGRSTWADYKQPRSYDVLVLDQSQKRWTNAFPPGVDWGPAIGACSAPPWKDEHFRFDDSAGNVRPNWTVYGTFSLGRKFGYDSHTKSFVFYAGGKTFRYEPASRKWTDLAPATHPEQELGGRLLWSSMCYEPVGRQFILFGGGNVQTPRGDPGTWSYSPDLNEWKPLDVKSQPPQRANSQLAYDPVQKRIVLFGGDRLDALLSDTWAFDPTNNTWEEIAVPLAPAPRAGHALLWVPKLKSLVLLGGYTYTSAVGYVESLYRPLPMEAWKLDLASREWELIGRWETKDSAPQPPANSPLTAAVDDSNQIVVQSNGTWRIFLTGQSNADETAKHGVKPGTLVRRTGPHDPAWLQQDVPAAQADRVTKELEALPANTWLLRPTPKLPRPNMDWGSAVFAPDHDLIVRFSGGHSAYSGTAPIVYDVKTDRYSLPFFAEYPIEYVYSNDQVNGEWSFQNRPWMTGHTYKSTGYDPVRKQFVFAPHEYTYFFDTTKSEWIRSTERNPYRSNFYVVTVCSTPQGAVVWADKPSGGDGLWQLDSSTTAWKPLPLSGDVPAKSADQHGMAYDSQRDRLLLFSGIGKQAGNIAAVDRKSGRAEWLNPAGQAAAIEHARETIYLPELDAVLLGARVKDPKDHFEWLLYDCGKNTWCGLRLTGNDPISRGTFNNSMGLMYDPNRKLVWAVGQNSHVHVLRIDPVSLPRRHLD